MPDPQCIRRYSPEHEEERRAIFARIAALQAQYHRDVRPYVDRLVALDAVTPSTWIVPYELTQGRKSNA